MVKIGVDDHDGIGLSAVWVITCSMSDADEGHEASRTRSETQVRNLISRGMQQKPRRDTSPHMTWLNECTHTFVFNHPIIIEY